MIKRLESIIARFNELGELMSRQDATKDMKVFTELAREHSALSELVENAEKYIKISQQIREDEQILDGDDDELKEMVNDEIGSLHENLVDQEKILKILLIPKNPDDDKNTILEIVSNIKLEKDYISIPDNIIFSF